MGLNCLMSIGRASRGKPTSPISQKQSFGKNAIEIKMSLVKTNKAQKHLLHFRKTFAFAKTSFTAFLISKKGSTNKAFLGRKTI